MTQFVPFPKLSRIHRPFVITEKIDGSNAAVQVVPLADAAPTDQAVAVVDGFALYAQSRTRLITPGKTTDNFGFAAWVQENAPALLGLGAGTHFGEWYGQGIQRAYGLTERRFALFNAVRWAEWRPECCGVVPLLLTGEAFDTDHVDIAVQMLVQNGSFAVTGFAKPEGVVIFHVASGVMFKRLIENDDIPKSQVAP